MDQFRELSTFVAVAEEGTFRAAARRLNLSPSVITRLVNDLEERLGVRLLTRTTRKIALTEAGERLFHDAGRLLIEISDVEAAAAGARQTPRGTLRVTAPVTFGQIYILPILCEFLAANPGVTAYTMFLDRIVDLIDEGLDVALRIGDLPDSSLTATRVGTLRRVVCASPEYLENRGVPQSPEDLAAHEIIQPRTLHDGPTWPFVSGGRTHVAKVAPRLNVNTVASTINAASAGWGITRALSYQVADAISEGTLVEILREWEDRELPIHLVHHEGKLSAAKTRAFIDFAAHRLRAQATQISGL